MTILTADRPLAVNQRWYDALLKNTPRSVLSGNPQQSPEDRGPSLDLRRAFQDDRSDEDPTADIVIDRGVAIVPIHGLITKRGRFWWMKAFSSDHGCLVLQRLVHRSDVRAIVLDVDSGGGQVDGTAGLADCIGRLKAVKPIHAAINEYAASAAYWIAAACTAVSITTTGEAGSIGVYMLHTDWSEMESELGIKTTVIYAGRYKAAHERPLDDDTTKFYQDQIDELYRLFVESVATNRRVPVAQVLESMADARIFIGQQAVDAGLADRIATIDQVRDELAASARTSFSGGFADGSRQHHSSSGQRTIQRRRVRA